MRFSIQHGLTACNVRLSAPCIASHAPKVTINGTVFTVATVRIVGNAEAIREPFRSSYRGSGTAWGRSLDDFLEADFWLGTVSGVLAKRKSTARRASPRTANTLTSLYPVLKMNAQATSVSHDRPD